jgi:VCBS repeat-containing protein
MRSMTFLVNDRATGGGPTPAVAVTVTENADGTVSISINVVGGVTGDLRGFFFDVANESRIGTLSVIPTSPGFTEFRQGNDNVRDLGNGANMNGLLGSDGGFDAGVEIGKAGIGHGDDYQSFSFTLKSSAGALTLDDFANVDFGVRLNSVGRDSFCGDRDRDGEAKLLETVGRAMDAKDDAGALTEDAPVSKVTGNVFSNDLYLKPLHLITAVNGSAANIGDEINGLYGTFRLHLDGSYTYKLDNSRAATQALAAGQQVLESFTYTAKNLDELVSVSTDSAVVRITITGADDNNAPVVTAAIAAGEAIELADNSPGEGVQPHSASGTVDFSDVNLTDSHTVSVAAAAAGYLGTLSASVTNPSTGDGAGQVAWDFAVSDGAIEHLGTGETLTQSYALTLDDGHGGTATQQVTITLTGSNDAPTITAGTTSGVLEEDTVEPAAGTVDFADLDLSDSHGLSVTPAAPGYVGTLNAAVDNDSTGDGTGRVGWTFDVSLAAVQHLGAGDSLTQTYTIAVDDGHGGTAAQDVSITINGANDAPVIVAGDTAGQVFEDGSRRDGGQLVALDVDHGDTLTWSVSGSGPNTPRADYRALVDNFSIVRNGAQFFNDDFNNNVPPPAGPLGATSYFLAGGFTESGGRAILDGSLGNFANSSISNFATLNTDIGADPTQGLKRAQDFTVEARFDLSLPAEPRQLYSVRLSDVPDGGGNDIAEVGVRRMEDGSLAVVLREVDVLGVPPVILEQIALTPPVGANQIVLRLTHAAGSDIVTGSFDLLNGVGGTVTTHFTASVDIFSDEDWTRAQFVALSAPTPQNGVYGALTVDPDGEWHYALANNTSTVQQLAQGEHVTDIFTVRVTDEHGAFDTQTVTVDVAGSNDAPVISTASTTFGSVQEDFNPAASGQIVASDIDHGALLHYTVGPALQVPPPGVPGPVTFFTYRADYHFTLDQLRIERNGDVFVDDYEAGGPPPAAGGSLDGVPAGYLVPLNSFTESGGRLHFDGSLATAQRGIGNPNLTVGQLAVLATNNDPNDLTRGLKSDDDFTVEARYDLSLPDLGEVYGITLTDNAGSSLPQDRLGDSNMSLLVRRDAGGNLIVQLNDFDVVTDVGITRQVLLLEPAAGENQIVLRLVHDKDQPGIIRAEFDLVGGAGGPRTFAFTEVAHAFGAATPDYAGDDENWTRVQLVAFGPDQFNGSSLAGTYGTLSVQQNGQWTYALDPVAAQALALGQFFVENFSVRVTDEHGLSSARIVQAFVNGSNDQVVATGGVVGAEVQEDGNLFASGNVTFFDPDLIDVHSGSFSFAGSSLGFALGTFSLGLLTESPTTTDGSIGWTYTLNNDAAQFLVAGQTVTEFYQVDVFDPFSFGFGASQLVAITIHGADEIVVNTPPVANPDANDGDPVFEGGFDAQASGNVLVNDIDPDPNPGLHVTAVNAVPFNVGNFVTGTYGSVQLHADGSWTYFLDSFDSDTNALAQGEIAFDQFTYTVADAQGASSSTTLTIEVTGGNDAPLLQPASGSVAEDGVLSTGGQLLASDPDHGAVLRYQLNGATSFEAGYQFAIDQFILTRLRPGLDAAPVQILNDDFGDNAPPPGSPPYSNGVAVGYGTRGGFLEAGGRALMDGDLALQTFNFATPAALVINSALALTMTNADPNAGLRAGHQFDVVARFDAIVPALVGEGYGIAFSDSTPTFGGDDNIQLFVRRDEDGVVRIVLREADTGVFTTTLIGSIELPAVGAGDQIELRLAHRPDQPGRIEGSFTVWDDGVAMPTYTFENSGQVFGLETPGTGDDEAFTRAQFFATGPAQVTQRTGIYGTMVLDAATGEWQYSLDNSDPDVQALAQGQTVLDTFDAIAIDQFNFGSVAPIQISVHGANDAPVAGDDSVAEVVTEDAPVSIAVLGNDDDVDSGHTLTVTGAFTSARGAAVTVNPDGTIQYDARDSAELQALNAGQSLDDTFTYQVSDEHGATDTATVSLIVQGADDAPVELADGSVFEDGARYASGELDTDGATVTSVSGSGPNTLRADYRFLLDNLAITRSLGGSPLAPLGDGFNNGVPPPVGETPTPIPGYFTTGTFLEGSGRLIMDGSLAVSSPVPPPPGVGAVLVHNATLNTDTGADASQGLKRAQDFAVEARFDLVTLDEVLETYGVRLSDNADDVIEIDVRRIDSETVAVVLRESDAPGAAPLVIGQLNLTTAPGDNQIALRLSHAADASFVTASFQVLNGGAITQAGSFFSAPDIFTGEDWTRVQINAFGPAAPQNGQYGTLEVDAEGDWSYSLANNAPNVQALAQGETVRDTFTVTLSDGTSQTIEVDVTGSEDSPQVVNATSPFSGGYVLEDGAQQTASGTALGFDADHGATLHWSVTRGPAYSSSYLVRLDELTVTKNNAAFFNDAFNDGIAPAPNLPSGGNPMSAAGFSYLPSGGFTESADRLVIDGQLAGARQGTDVDQLVAGHLLSLGSNIDPNDLTRGLKIDDDFTVTARYDLALPALDGQSYGVSLTDNVSGSLPYDQHGDDVITVEVARVGGELRIQLLDRDVAADRTTVLQSMLLTPLAGEDQIVLRLTHDAANAGVVEASFDVLAGGAFSRSVSFTETAHIFGTDTAGTGDDENWTRVQLIATGLDQSGASALQGTFGTFSIDSNTGAWTYVLDNAAAQGLAHGSRVFDNFNVRVIDEFGQSTSRQFGIAVIGTAEGPTPPGLTVVPDPTNPNAQIISGTDGNDLIAGGAGADLLIGHAGADTFRYDNLGDAVDTIADFSKGSGGDVLDLHNLLASIAQPGVNLRDLVFFAEFDAPGFGPSTDVVVDQNGLPGEGIGLAVARLHGITGVTLDQMLADGNLIL